MSAAPDYKIINTRRGRRFSSQAGVTLVEFMIAVGLAGLFATVLVSITLTTGRSFAEIVNYVDLDNYNRIALDNISREVRQVNFLATYDATHLSFVDNDNQPLTYQYVPASGTLTRTKNGATTLLLRGCDSMQFTLYQRSPVTNSFDLIPVTEATNCKVISITWTCSRSLLRLKANTEAAQASKIVIRNKQS